MRTGRSSRKPARESIRSALMGRPASSAPTRYRLCSRPQGESARARWKATKSSRASPRPHTACAAVRTLTISSRLASLTCTGPAPSPGAAARVLQRVGEHDVDRDLLGLLQHLADGRVEVAVLVDQHAGPGVVPGAFDLKQLLRESADRRPEFLRM